MSRTPIQVPVELKERLELLKSQFHKPSLPETIDFLIKLTERDARDRQNRIEKEKEEKQRYDREDIHLGAELKKRIVEIAQSYAISPAGMVEVIADHFDASAEISKSAISTLVRHRV